MPAKEEILGDLAGLFSTLGMEEQLFLQRLVDVFPRIRVYTQSVDVSSVSANSTAEQDITVTGVASNDVVLAVNKPSHTSGLSIGNYRVKAKNTVSVTFVNTTGGAIDPAAENYEIIVLRKGL